MKISTSKSFCFHYVLLMIFKEVLASFRDLNNNYSNKIEDNMQIKKAYAEVSLRNADLSLNKISKCASKTFA